LRAFFLSPAFLEKGFIAPPKSLVENGKTEILCYRNKMLSSLQNVWLLLQNPNLIGRF